jgi:hypothetical protein
MQKPATLAQVRTELATNRAHVFHSSLTLYVLAEKRPRPDNPDWIEVGCLNQSGVVGMMVYLSPLDALLDAKMRNRKGANVRVHPFEAIDPRPFIAEHEDWLTVYLVYGFAGRGKQMLVSQRGDIQALTSGLHFHVTPDQREHFHLSFSDEVVAGINALHRAANMHDYARIVEEQAECSFHELERLAQEATQCAQSAVIIGNDNITHCALYDPIERKWSFAALADVPC